MKFGLHAAEGGVTGHDKIRGGGFLGGLEGLVFDDIQTGACDASLTEGLQDSSLLDDGFAGCIDDKSAGFEQGEVDGTQKVKCGFVSRWGYEGRQVYCLLD